MKQTEDSARDNENQERIQTFAHATPSHQDKRLEAWASVVGHYKRNEYSTMRTRTEPLIMYCTAGKGTLGLGDVCHEFGAGDIILQPAHLTNACTLDPTVGADVWWVIFGGAYAQNLLEMIGLSAITPVIQIGPSESLISDFHRVFNALEAKTPTTHLDATETLIGILFRVLRLRRMKHADESRLFQHVHYLAESVDQIAQASGYSKHHFIRLFKATTGMTPWQYVLHLKIDKAKDLLLTSRLPIKEVAAQVDIPNPLYFSRLFRKQTGMAPSQFRKQS